MGVHEDGRPTIQQVVNEAPVAAFNQPPERDEVLAQIFKTVGIEYHELPEDQQIASKGVLEAFALELLINQRNIVLEGLLIADPPDVATDKPITLFGNLSDEDDRGVFVATRIFGEIPGEAL